MLKYPAKILIPVITIIFFHAPASFAHSETPPSKGWIPLVCGPILVGALKSGSGTTGMVYKQAFGACALFYGVLQFGPQRGLIAEISACLPPLVIGAEIHSVPQQYQTPGVSLLSLFLDAQFGYCVISVAATATVSSLRAVLSSTPKLISQEQLYLLIDRWQKLGSDSVVNDQNQSSVKQEREQVYKLIIDLMRFGKIEQIAVQGGELVLECGDSLGFNAY